MMVVLVKIGDESGLVGMASSLADLVFVALVTRIHRSRDARGGCSARRFSGQQAAQFGYALGIARHWRRRSGTAARRRVEAKGAERRERFMTRKI